MKMKTHLPKTVKLIKCEEKIDEDPLSREWCAAQCSPMPRAMCAHLLANIFYNVYYLVKGLQKLWNPAIMTWRTRSTLGEHWEHRDQGEYGVWKTWKGSKTSTQWLKTLNLWLKTIYFTYCDGQNHNIPRLENKILGQIKIGELQGKRLVLAWFTTQEM